MLSPVFSPTGIATRAVSEGAVMVVVLTGDTG
jgi:hypothetical protein